MTNSKDFTLYSGGHMGAESEFGAQAEAFGVAEVNFSYEGHEMKRSRGIVVLGSAELARGDVSMEIVSKSLGRKYHQAEKIRMVIQSIFHMVNSGFQIFAVGWIKPDNTVKGGTGWGVELGRLFNRPVSVFDQEKNKWFTWKENAWVEDKPVISSTTFVGTGTRELTEEGRRAIGELFKRSFAGK